MSAAPAAFDLRPVETASDWQQAQRLLQDNLPGASADLLAHKFDLAYRANPAGTGRLFMLRAEAQGAGVGMQGIHPRRFWLGDQVLAAANLADFAVDPQHRSVGPALALMRLSLSDARQSGWLVYGMPNRKAAAVCQRAGMKKLGDLVRYVKPLRTGALLARRAPGPLARWAAAVLDQVLRLRDGWRWAKQRPRHLTWARAGFDDPAIEAVWQARAAGTVYSERSTAMLAWRYGQPGRGAWHLEVARSQQRPLGWVVWRQKDACTVEIGDFLCAPDASLVAALMLGFAARMRRTGVEFISLSHLGSPAVTQGLLAAGFVARADSTPLMLDSQSAWPAGLPAAGHFTNFDNDAD